MTAGLERGYIFHLGTLQHSLCRVNQTTAVGKERSDSLEFFFNLQRPQIHEEDKKNQSISAVQTEKRETKLRFIEHYTVFLFTISILIPPHFLKSHHWTLFKGSVRSKGRHRQLKARGLSKNQAFSQNRVLKRIDKL